MALKEKITVDMQDAMRSKDSEKLNAIRLLQSSIKQKEVDDRVEIDDTMILNIIEKMLKQRRDSIEAFKKANRNDLVAKEEFEVKLLQTYMPEPLSSEDVEKEIDSAIKAADAKSMKDMGTVMSAVKLKVSGRANMAEVSQKIKEKLTKA
ncbi:GatB/YqeY domain-containing protein [Methylophilaceae bacterium]|nr:GatB/YqeY domain-containing protein [Methylophilaceae bacterium]